MRHNVIIGKSYDGHMEFMSIRPPMKEWLAPSSKNITKLIKRSPCASFCGFILESTPWTKSDYVLKFGKGRF